MYIVPSHSHCLLFKNLYAMYLLYDGCLDCLLAPQHDSLVRKGYYICSNADINECELKTHTCSWYAKCINTEGGFDCECFEGYEGDGFTCKGKYEVNIVLCSTCIYSCVIQSIHAYYIHVHIHATAVYSTCIIPQEVLTSEAEQVHLILSLVS